MISYYMIYYNLVNIGYSYRSPLCCSESVCNKSKQLGSADATSAASEARAVNARQKDLIVFKRP